MSGAGSGRVVVVRRPTAEAADAVRRAWDAGHPVLVLDPHARRAEIDRILERMRPAEGAVADVAAVAVTSGTSGEPKGAELTWDGLAASAAAVGTALGIGPGDRWLACLPLHYVAGLAVLGRAWVGGVPVTVLDGFDVDTVSRAAAAGATLVSLVPTMLRRLRAAGVGADRFRSILVGGGPVTEAGENIIATYGMTETWGGVVHDGHPLAGVEVALGDLDEILLRAPMVMRGYRLDPGRTAAALGPGGWFRTGDVGAFEADGRLRVIDRLDDLIVSGGVKVSPTEVEGVLAGHPLVGDVAVAGVPDPEWGERVVAYVNPSDPARPPELADLRAYAAERLSAPKLPRQLVMVDSVPRSSGGKLLRRLLADASWSGWVPWADG